jgi:hypothetical protein
MTSAEIADALRLEEIEFVKSAEDANLATQARIKAMEMDMAKRGLHSSGARYKLDLEIRFEKTERLIDHAVAKRKQIGQRFPELLTPAHLDQLKKRLNDCVHATTQAQYDRMKRDPSGIATTAFVGALNTTAEQTADRLRAKITSEIDILRLEARLGLNEGDKLMTFNISNSTVTNLNLGTVLGDLSASVQLLNNHGQNEFARQIQDLTEALASANIPDDQRREFLEHLAVVSSEVSLPPERRKIAPLRASITALRDGLANAAQLAALWPPIEHLLKSFGVLS